MVSILVNNHVTIKAEVNGAHNGVSALLMNEVLQRWTVRVDHLMKAIQNRIGVALVRVLGEESRLLCRDSQSLGKLLGILFRYELLRAAAFMPNSAGLEAILFIPYNEKPIASSTYFGTMNRTVFSGSTIWQTRTSATSESSMTRSASDSLVRDASKSTIC